MSLLVIGVIRRMVRLDAPYYRIIIESFEKVTLIPSVILSEAKNLVF